MSANLGNIQDEEESDVEKGLKFIEEIDIYLDV